MVQPGRSSDTITLEGVNASANCLVKQIKKIVCTPSKQAHLYSVSWWPENMKCSFLNRNTLCHLL